MTEPFKQGGIVQPPSLVLLDESHRWVVPAARLEQWLKKHSPENPAEDQPKKP